MKTRVLSIGAVVAVVCFFTLDHMKGDSEPRQDQFAGSVAETVPSAQVGTPVSSLAVGSPDEPLAAPAPVSEAVRFNEKFRSAFARFSQGDPGVTMEDLDALEREAYELIEKSPEARALLAQQLRESMRSGNYLPMQHLERAFTTSIPGIAELKEIYREEIERGGRDDWYALQNINRLQEYMSEPERVRLLEAAFRQFDRHQSTGHWGGALNFMTEALRNPINNVPVTHREMALRMIEARHQNAQTETERMFLAQSLYQLLPMERRIELAYRNLSNNPTPAAIQAILEAAINQDFVPDSGFLNALRQVLPNVPLNTEQESLARAVLAASTNPPISAIRPIGG
jgi:hypothetical protein